jgi:type II secretory pathway pseudopilin PulG
MKRTIKSIAGVTLLEIMLVLAIAAMIITMSVKYYQTANNVSHINTFVEQMSAIAAAADNLAQQNGSYASSTSAALSSALPGGWNFTPWGSKITVTPSASSLAINVPSIPGAICTRAITAVTNNSHFVSSISSCSTTTTSTFTYSP